MTDIVVIGGGASGIVSAIMAKRLCNSLSITVLEANDRILKKLLVTGNGQCNITNLNFSPDNYHGKDVSFITPSFEKFTPKDQIAFFESIGVPICFEPSNKGYPSSYQASSVVDCIRFEAEKLKINILCNNTVSDIKKTGKNFNVYVNDRILKCKCVVLSCGGIAGGRLGSDSGYSLMKKLGHKISELYPAIVQIKTLEKTVKQLKGIKVNCLCSAIVRGKPIRKEYGEVLFCDYGLSGPPILQLSRIASLHKGTVISLDVFPNLDLKQLNNLLLKRQGALSNRLLEDFFTGIINKRLGQVVVKLSGLPLNGKTASLSYSDIEKLSKTLKNFEFTTVGTTGMSNAQVTAGGVFTEQFYPETLMSKKAKGVFCTGELLDIDGDCGGFNLSWCWASANTVATAVCNYVNQG